MANVESGAWHTTHASPSVVVFANACEAAGLSSWHARQAAAVGVVGFMKPRGVTTLSRLSFSGNCSELFTWHFSQLRRSPGNRMSLKLLTDFPNPLTGYWSFAS